MRRADLRLRRSLALVAWPHGAVWSVRNFVLGTTTRCRARVIAALDRFHRPARISSLVRALAATGERAPAKLVARLCEAGVLVAVGSPVDRLERRWSTVWRWGPLCAAFHRSLRDLRFASPAEAKATLVARARRRPPPRALPESTGPRRSLPAPCLSRGILAQLSRRETVRDLSGEAVTAAELAYVLYAGFGVRALVDNPVHGTLPLKLAPSGGACNAIDGYVCVYGVQGLASGAYRYSGLDRDLVVVGEGSLPAARLLLGGQPWAEGAAAIVFLVASFDRAWWKYEHPLSYRMVLLEAGHIAQNVLVTASVLGLAAWPSGAVADTAVERLLRLRAPEQAALYAVVLGRRLTPAQGKASNADSTSRRSGKSASESPRR